MKVLLHRIPFLLILLLHLFLIVVLPLKKIFLTQFYILRRVRSGIQCSILVPKLPGSIISLNILAQKPCAMSTMEVLQSFLMRSKNLLSSLDALDPKNSNTITFNVENYK